MSDTFQFEPSAVHWHLMNELSPSHAYRSGDVGEWQAELQPLIIDKLGMAGAERSELNVRSLWTQQHEHGTIEKIVFTSEPNCDVPAYVCLPKDAKPPYQFFICLQGHSTGAHNSIGKAIDDEFTDIEVAGDRDFGIGCMKRGIAALCIEQRSFGYRKETRVKNMHHGCHDATMHAMMLGRTLMGERVYDVDRGIDYLAERGDVQMDRVGVMGNSGGGTISLFAAATLPRIAFAMPSCYFCTFKASIMSIYHCVDNYLPGLLPVAEMADVMGVFAPKPVTLVAGKDDEIFPIEAVHEAFEHLQTIYAAAGAPDMCRLVVGQGGHRFYAEDAWPVMLDLMTCV